MAEKFQGSVADILEAKRSIEQWSRRRSSVFNVEERNVGSHESRSSSFCLTSNSNLAKSKPKYENTFKLEPDVRPKLKPIQDLAENCLSNILSGQNYEPEVIRQLVPRIADEIKKRAKNCDGFVDRYRVLVSVWVGQKQFQDMRIVSKRLYLSKYDTFTEARFENSELYAIATVDLMYLE